MDRPTFERKNKQLKLCCRRHSDMNAHYSCPQEHELSGSSMFCLSEHFFHINGEVWKNIEVILTDAATNTNLAIKGKFYNLPDTARPSGLGGGCGIVTRFCRKRTRLLSSHIHGYIVSLVIADMLMTALGTHCTN